MIWFILLIITLVFAASTDVFKKSLSTVSFRCSVLLMILIAGFRNMGGEDYLIYKNHFYGNEPEPFELGYELLVKVFSFCGFSYEFFVFTISSICLISLAKFIVAYSPKPNISLALYTGAFFIYYNLIATRQLIALTIFLLALHFLINKKDIKFLFIVFVGSFFHSSILIALGGFLFMRFAKLGIVIVLLLLFAFFILSFDLPALVALASQYGLSFIEKRMVYDYLQADREIPPTTFFRVILTFGLFLYYNFTSETKDGRWKIFFSFYTMFFILFILFNQYDIMMRLWVYFEIVSIIMVPIIFLFFRNHFTKLLLFLFYIAFYFSSFFNNLFFFDDGDLLKYNLVFFK